MANILVIKLDALGDFILSLPAMAALRQKHSTDSISLLTTRPFLDVAQKSGYFDQIIIDPKAKFYDIADWLRLKKVFNDGDFDRVYDLQMDDRTGFYYRFFKQKPEWSGNVMGASHPFDDPDQKNRSVFQNHKLRLEALGVDVNIPDLSWMKTDVSFFKLKKPYVLCMPGSAPRQTHKRWPVMKYAALAKKLSNENYMVGILGTDAEFDLAQKMIKICPEARDLTGQTSLFDIASLAMEADFAIGNDIGPMHLISLTGCPVVSLFSNRTNPALSAPLGRNVTVLQSDLIADITVGDVMKRIHLSPKTHVA